MSSKQEEEVKSVPNDNGDDDDCDDLRTRTTYQLFLEIQRLAMLHHSVKEHATTPVGVVDAFSSSLYVIQDRVDDINSEIRRRRAEKRTQEYKAEKEKAKKRKKPKSMIPDE